jgi:hypothetical protein
MASAGPLWPDDDQLAVSACKPERDHGKDIFEVKLARPGGERLEVDAQISGPTEALPRSWDMS